MYFLSRVYGERERDADNSIIGDENRKIHFRDLIISFVMFAHRNWFFELLWYTTGRILSNFFRRRYGRTVQVEDKFVRQRFFPPNIIFSGKKFGLSLAITLATSK